jgi:hypothetical protein
MALQQHHQALQQAHQAHAHAMAMQAAGHPHAQHLQVANPTLPYSPACTETADLVGSHGWWKKAVSNHPRANGGSFRWC